MTDTKATPLGPDELPLPMGVQAESGEFLPGLTPEDLRHIDEGPDAVQCARVERQHRFPRRVRTSIRTSSRSRDGASSLRRASIRPFARPWSR